MSAPPRERRGLLHHWGPQAWLDLLMCRLLIVQRAGPLVGYTFVPILRLAADPVEVDHGYAEILSRRETTRLFDSPRERWRKSYGNFVREVEWAILELRKHFRPEQVEEIVAGNCAALSRERSARFLEWMNRFEQTRIARNEGRPGETVRPRGLQKRLFELFNPAGFLTGPAEIREIDPAGGSLVMEVPDCAWHVCAPRETLPDPSSLPEQGCLLVCKAHFERLFDGASGGVAMAFDPHLPDTSCTVEIRWKAKS